MTIISKTDYILYRECKKNVWLKIHRPDIFNKSELTEFEKTIIETGNEVELLARKLFPSGVLIEGRKKADQEKTAELLAAKTPVIFQPIFVKDGFLAAVDILERTEINDLRGPKNRMQSPDLGGQEIPSSDAQTALLRGASDEQASYNIYEVKATSKVEEHHYYDLAFQVNLLRKFNLKVSGIKVVHLNPKYVRHGELDLKNLFVIEDVSEEVEKIIDEVSAEMNAALKYLSSEKEPAGHCDCINKSRNNHCTTFSYSNPDVPEYSVHDIARIGSSKKKLQQLIDMNIFHIHEIPEEIEFTEIQKNQIQAHVLDKVLMEKELIAKELSDLVFPLYFLDYETCPAAIPRFDGYSPYNQIPFQYSLHKLNSPPDKEPFGKAQDEPFGKAQDEPFGKAQDEPFGKAQDEPFGKAQDEPEHFEFLYKKSDDPSRALAETLQSHIGDKGTVIVWNKKFESQRNNEIGKRLPEFKMFMDGVNARIYDLMDIFTKQYYVHKDFKGSTSIKYVLPVLAPELTYKNLNIREGGTASQSWDKIAMSTLPKDEKDQIAKDLLAYCERDTYAMYAIWRELYKLIN